MKMSKLSKMVREIKNLAEELRTSRMFRHHHRHSENKNMEDSAEFKKTVSLLVKHYNSFLELAREKKYLEEEIIFKKLPADARLHEVYIDAALLAKYLKEDNEKHFCCDEEVHRPGRGVKIKKIKIDTEKILKSTAKVHKMEEKMRAKAEKMAEKGTRIAEQAMKMVGEKLNINLEDKLKAAEDKISKMQDKLKKANINIHIEDEDEDED